MTLLLLSVMASNSETTLEAEKLLDNVDDIQEKMDITPTETVANQTADQEGTGAAAHLPSSLKKLKIKVVKFLEPSFGESCAKAIGATGCGLCGISLKGDLLRIHVRRHLTRFFCKCGKSASTKSLLCEHIHAARREGVPSHMDVNSCYEVDSASFGQFKSEVKLPTEIEFGELLRREQKNTEMEKRHDQDASDQRTEQKIEPKPSTSASTATIRCQDIRLTMSKEDIAKDAKKIREQRKRSSNSNQDKRDKKRQLAEVQPPDTKLVRVEKERDELLRENTRLREKYRSARKTLKKVKGHLDKMQQLQHQVSVSQAALDCHLG